MSRVVIVTGESRGTGIIYHSGEKGIMRDALRETIALSFSNTNIERIFAYVFSFNFASQKQLLDSVFKQETILQRGTYKNG